MIRNCRKVEAEKNPIWAEKDKMFDNKNWKTETGTNRRRGKGRKDTYCIVTYRNNAKQKEGR